MSSEYILPTLADISISMSSWNDWMLTYTKTWIKISIVHTASLRAVRNISFPSPYQTGSSIVNLAVSYPECELSDEQFQLAFCTLAKINLHHDNAHTAPSYRCLCTLVSWSHLSSRLEHTHDLPQVKSMKISGPLWGFLVKTEVSLDTTQDKEHFICFKFRYLIGYNFSVY